MLRLGRIFGLHIVIVVLRQQALPILFTGRSFCMVGEHAARTQPCCCFEKLATVLRAHDFCQKYECCAREFVFVISGKED